MMVMLTAIWVVERAKKREEEKRVAREKEKEMARARAREKAGLVGVLSKREREREKKGWGKRDDAKRGT